MKSRHPGLQLASLSLPAILIVGACVLYARVASIPFPNGKLREIDSALSRTPDHPGVRLELVRTFRLPGAVLNLNGEGDLLYASMASSGFATVDISNPAAPVVKEHMTLGGSTKTGEEQEYAINAFPLGDRLIVLDRVRGMVVYDRSDPAANRLLWSMVLPGSPTHQAIDLQKAGDRLYLACGGAGVRMLPADFTQESVSAALLDRFDHTTDVAFLPPRWMLVADGRDTGIQILDVASADEPRVVGTWGAWPLFLEHVVFVKNHAYVAARGDNALLIFNLENPALPYLSGLHRQKISSIRSIATWKDRYVLVGNAFQFIDVFDAADPERPKYLSQTAAPGRVHALYAHGDHVYAGLWPHSRIAIYRIVEQGEEGAADGTPV